MTHPAPGARAVPVSLLSSLAMDLFVIPVGREQYELYCEQPCETGAEEDEPSPDGVFARLKRRFTLMLNAAEQRQRAGHVAAPEEDRGWLARLNDRMLSWVVERIAEQRLLWNLRRQTAAVVAHPHDMTFDQVLTLVRRTLQRDYDRHRIWLIIDTIGLIVSGALMLVPGPNLVAYYFAFRVVGHWLSMRGARQGLDCITWTGRPCPPLGELREAADLDPVARHQRVDDVAARLRLPHLSAFFERVVVAQG